MIIKEVINENLLTMAEVREILNNVREERLQEETELGYELRKAIHHAENFTKLDIQITMALLKRLNELEKMRPEIAIKIADILPQSIDEVRSIYAKERFTLTEEEIKQILNIITDVTGIKTVTGMEGTTVTGTDVKTVSEIV